MTKNNRKIVISGTGCALADFLYTNVRFGDPIFKQYLSKQDGDGGLSPGKLVFKEDLEKYSGKSFEEVLLHLVGKKLPDAFNLGGPGLVSFIHVAQMLEKDEFETRFYGVLGEDGTSKKIFNILKRGNLDFTNYRAIKGGETPYTVVLSDPTYDDGCGERSFIHNLGIASRYTPDMLESSFYDADIICLGGTALVPDIHDNLDVILQTAKEKSCITIVNTVYDFRNEKDKPRRPWPLVSSDNYSLIDLLIMDKEEALKISGMSSLKEAVNFFVQSGVRAFIVTNGALEITIFSHEGLFLRTEELKYLPISERVSFDLTRISSGQRDTTGCGDNFAGGVIASVAKQLKRKHNGKLDLIEAASWGIVSGGLSCTYTGGAYVENDPGEKRSKIIDLYNAYQIQLKRGIKTERNKLVMFGAGKIGRSFIGQIFSAGGYDVVFVDISEAIIEELNRKKCYQVWFVNDEFKKCVTVKNVRGVYAGNEEDVVNEISTAGLIAISVGVGALQKALPIIAKGLLRRSVMRNNDPLDIIIAENMVGAADYLREKLSTYLPTQYDINSLVGLVETSVGKMVPLITPDNKEPDILTVYAEPYNTLIVDGSAFKTPIPAIDGISPKENMKAWVERKLYIHNLGHSAAAYIGHFYYSNYNHIYEVLSEKRIFDKVRNAMVQSASILIKKYPGEFTKDELISHIDDLLVRFQNRTLADTVFRVGCDLKRKLGETDRFVGIIKSAISLGMPYDAILEAVICAVFFAAKDNNDQVLEEDVNFLNNYQDNISLMLTEICGFDKIKNASLFIDSERTYKCLHDVHLKASNLQA